MGLLQNEVDQKYCVFEFVISKCLTFNLVNSLDDALKAFLKDAKTLVKHYFDFFTFLTDLVLHMHSVLHNFVGNFVRELIYSRSRLL